MKPRRTSPVAPVLALSGLALLALLALGCGLVGDEPPPAPPPEPLPVVLPPSVATTWWATTPLPDRNVIQWTCDGVLLHLELPQGGPVTVTGPDSVLQATLTMAELKSDASVQVTTDRGDLNLVDREEGLVYARGSLPGFREGLLLGSPDSDHVEQIHPPARECGRSLDTSGLSWLSGARFNSTGDPCVAAGLSVDLSSRRPVLSRSGMDLEIKAVHPGDHGTWVTVADASGGLHGLRFVRGEGGTVQVWQRLDTGMSFETLKPMRGLCSSPPSMPTGADRQRGARALPGG